MVALTLAATTRTTTGKTVHNLRDAGSVPAVMYGHGAETRSLTVDALSMEKIWQQAGESTLVDVCVDGQAPIKAIIHDVQFVPRTGRIMHVDFHQVNMKEKVRVPVELSFIGEAPAVKEQGGILLPVKQEVEIECLPSDLIKEITVDISGLATFSDMLYVKDLVVPQGVVILDAPEEVIVQVEEPRTEAEMAELESTVQEDVSQVGDAVEKKPEETDEAAAEVPAKDTPTK